MCVQTLSREGSGQGQHSTLNLGLLWQINMSLSLPVCHAILRGDTNGQLSGVRSLYLRLGVVVFDCCLGSGMRLPLCYGLSSPSQLLVANPASTFQFGLSYPNNRTDLAVCSSEWLHWVCSVFELWPLSRLHIFFFPLWIPCQPFYFKN